MHIVSVSRIDGYDVRIIRSSIERMLKEMDYKIPRNQSVLIKPNLMAQNRPNQHTTTNHVFLEALLAILSDSRCKISIGDSIAFFQNGLTRKAFSVTKIEDVARKYGAKLVPFEEEKLKKIDLSGYPFLADFPVKEIYVPAIIFEVDTFINACKLKSHGNGFRLSGALKNLYGIIPGGFKQKIHIMCKDDMATCDLIVSLHQITRPSLHIMDAIIGLDGGPSAFGKPVKVGAIIASENGAALDTVASGIIGYEPEEVPLLVRAKALGLISYFSDTVVKGEPPKVSFKKLFRGPFSGKRKKDNVFITDTFVYPVVIGQNCDNCGECVSFCPKSAIKRSLEGDYSIDYNVCIFCYYCLTGCTRKAIGFKSTMKNKVIRFLWKTLRL